ncbi:hypothetical protein Q9L58_003148 [Maublancomyces gigas]|uniref:Aminoglycoside phosphotransferase domain-containing protein n=1 Tax=Discina gigas TaxID=1032678 RepID=A0ABR3GPT2_9PEZI
MGSASSKAWSIGRYFDTYQSLQAILRTSDDHTGPAKTKITELPDRGQKVKLVELLEPKSTQPNARFILESGNLVPDLLSQVGCLLFVRAHTSIPVPRVYAWSAEAGQEYLALEYVEGEFLSSVWGGYTEEEKEAVAVKLAKIITEMVEIRFDGVGGILPTVKESKTSKGRNKLHAKENYNTEPYYPSREDYHSYPGMGFNFWKTPLPTDLKTQRITLSKDSFPTSEPSVLCHHNFHGGNILVRGTDIVSVIGWDCAGSFPLSEAFYRGLNIVVRRTGDESVKENLIWRSRILNLAGDMMCEKGWQDEQFFRWACQTIGTLTN